MHSAPPPIIVFIFYTYTYYYIYTHGIVLRTRSDSVRVFDQLPPLRRRHSNGRVWSVFHGEKKVTDGKRDRRLQRIYGYIT